MSELQWSPFSEPDLAGSQRVCATCSTEQPWKASIATYVSSLASDLVAFSFAAVTGLGNDEPPHCTGLAKIMGFIFCVVWWKMSCASNVSLRFFSILLKNILLWEVYKYVSFLRRMLRGFLSHSVSCSQLLFHLPVTASTVLSLDPLYRLGTQRLLYYCGQQGLVAGRKFRDRVPHLHDIVPLLALLPSRTRTNCYLALGSLYATDECRWAGTDKTSASCIQEILFVCCARSSSAFCHIFNTV